MRKTENEQEEEWDDFFEIWRFLEFKLNYDAMRSMV